MNQIKTKFLINWIRKSENDDLVYLVFFIDIYTKNMAKDVEMEKDYYLPLNINKIITFKNDFNEVKKELEDVIYPLVEEFEDEWFREFGPPYEEEPEIVLLNLGIVVEAFLIKREILEKIKNNEYPKSENEFYDFLSENALGEKSIIFEYEGPEGELKVVK